MSRKKIKKQKDKNKMTIRKREQNFKIKKNSTYKREKKIRKQIYQNYSFKKTYNIKKILQMKNKNKEQRPNKQKHKEPRLDAIPRMQPRLLIPIVRYRLYNQYDSLCLYDIDQTRLRRKKERRDEIIERERRELGDFQRERDERKISLKI